MARSSKKKAKKYIYIVPVILWMAFIFYMSAKTGEGSSAVSNPITDLIVDIFQRALFRSVISQTRCKDKGIN